MEAELNIYCGRRLGGGLWLELQNRRRWPLEKFQDKLYFSRITCFFFTQDKNLLLFYPVRSHEFEVKPRCEVKIQTH